MDDSKKPPKDDDFLSAMEGVRKLPETEKKILRRRPKRKVRKTPPVPEKTYLFEIEAYGEQVEGLLVGHDRKQLRQLRVGEWPPEAEFDLHGLRSAEARVTAHRVVQDAYRSGVRSVLLIHGRGHHSGGESVLKKALPEWLVEPATASFVLAFCTSPIEYGGAGALLVLLRRNRSTGS